MAHYDWIKLLTTFAGAGVVAVLSTHVLPAGWDTLLASIVSALAALHIEPPHA